MNDVRTITRVARVRCVGVALMGVIFVVGMGRAQTMTCPALNPPPVAKMAVSNSPGGLDATFGGAGSGFVTTRLSAPGITRAQDIERISVLGQTPEGQVLAGGIA